MGCLTDVHGAYLKRRIGEKSSRNLISNVFYSCFETMSHYPIFRKGNLKTVLGNFGMNFQHSENNDITVHSFPFFGKNIKCSDVNFMAEILQL